MRLSLLLLAAALVAPLCAAHADFDRTALYRHLHEDLPDLPPGIEFDLHDLHPSSLHGFLTGSLEIRYQGRTQTSPIQISEDGHFYILSDVYTWGNSDVPGFKSAQGPGEAPKLHQTDDGKQLVVGDFFDLKVDRDKENLSKEKIKGVPFRGSASGIPFIEYSDLECPYCRAAHLALDKELLPAYGKKIRWIFKHNPLSGHPWSYRAAIAAACATRQKPEIGWKLESAFFENQESIKPDIDAPAFRSKAIELAKAAGADEGRFTTCFDKQESKPDVEADLKEAHDLGLNSTPAFVINGRVHHGFRGFEFLKEELDAATGEKGSK